MAHGHGMSHDEVKSTCDQLEASACQPSSSIYSGSDDNPKAKEKHGKHKSAAEGDESNFHGIGHGDRTHKK